MAHEFIIQKSVQCSPSCGIVYGLNRLMRFELQRFVNIKAAVRLRFRLRFERNVTLLTYKPLRLLCGLKIIQNTILAVRLRFEPQQSV
mgnify:CR=1 FL=1